MAVRMMMFVLVQFHSVLYSAGTEGEATNIGNADNEIIGSAAAAGNSSIAGRLGTTETA